jgi:hypothetical protein
MIMFGRGVASSVLDGGGLTKVASSCKGEVGLLEVNKGARVQGGKFIRHGNVNKEDWIACEMMGEGKVKMVGMEVDGGEMDGLTRGRSVNRGQRWSTGETGGGMKAVI